MDDGLCPGDAVDGQVLAVSESNQRPATPGLDVLPFAANRDRANPARLAQEQISGVRLANSARVVEHDFEYGLQISRRAGNDFQHFGSRGLLLQRLS